MCGCAVQGESQRGPNAAARSLNFSAVSFGSTEYLQQRKYVLGILLECIHAECRKDEPLCSVLQGCPESCRLEGPVSKWTKT